MTNDEIQKRVTFNAEGQFGFRISLVIRHSDLVILMSTLALCAVNPSFPAKRRMSSATNSSAARSYEMTDERFKKSFAHRPLAKRAVPPVGKTCEGPAT